MSRSCTSMKCMPACWQTDREQDISFLSLLKVTKKMLIKLIFVYL